MQHNRLLPDASSYGSYKQGVCIFSENSVSAHQGNSARIIKIKNLFLFFVITLIENNALWVAFLTVCQNSIKKSVLY